MGRYGDALVVAAATAPAIAEGPAEAAGGAREWERVEKGVDESVTNPAATMYTRCHVADTITI